MRRGPRLPAPLLLLAFLTQAECSLDRRGLGEGRTIDPAFRGCFFESRLRLGPGPVELPPTILIVQHNNNLLEGTGFGVFPEAEGWSFTGQVTAIHSADLHITIPQRDPISVRAILSESGDSLSLNTLPPEDVSAELLRCLE